MQKEYIKIINWIHAFDKKSTHQKVQMLQELPPAVINELMKWKPIVDSSNVLYNQESVPISPVSMKETSLEISKRRKRLRVKTRRVLYSGKKFRKKFTPDL
jgi:hypothetical protein